MINRKIDTETYRTHNEGKSVIAKKFLRKWSIKNYKNMTSISQNI